jgi:UPF0755 protein
VVKQPYKDAHDKSNIPTPQQAADSESKIAVASSPARVVARGAMEVNVQGTSARESAVSRGGTLRENAVGDDVETTSRERVRGERSRGSEMKATGDPATSSTPPLASPRSSSTNAYAYKKRARRRWKAAIAVVVSLTVLLGGAAAAGTYLLSLAAGGSGSGYGEVVFTVTEGQSLSEIADALEREGIIDSSTSFLLYLRIKRKSVTVKAGEYEMRYRMGAEAVIATFEAGPVVRARDITFPPGFTLRQQAERAQSTLGFSGATFTEALNANVDSAGFPEAPSAEGLCFPETYRVDSKSDEASLALTCLKQFQTVFSRLDKSRLSSLGVSPYQAVIVASLVEREAKVASERPVVASVIYNRLRRGMKLDIDATVLYALGEHKERLTYKDLEIDSPYNTYKTPGLPPTPIAAPAEASLMAALNPADTNYIYYVLTDPSGSHSFTSDPAEFERLKADAIARGVY